MQHQVDIIGVLLYLTSLICASATAKLSGLHSNDLHSGELVLPRRVAADGAFISKNLTYHHRHDHRRRRRAADNTDVNDDVVHYQLQLSNELLHLELQPHTYFMTPLMVIERHRRDLRTRSKPADINVQVDCHFQGKVRGHAYSNVAVSTCKGMVGHIKTQSNEYFIEPSKHHRAHPINGHPHVVFQRSSLKYKSNNNDNTNPNKRKHKYRRRKYKQSQQQQQGQIQRQQQNYQIQRVSNCGTKEPRRHIETRLEWHSQGKVKIQGGRKLRRQQLQHQRINQEELQLQETQIFRYQTENDTINSKQYNRSSYNNNNKNKNRRTNLVAPTITTSLASTSTEVPLSLLSATAAASIPAPSLLRDRKIDLEMTNNLKDLHRIKRSISSPRHVETLLVADSTMGNFHGKEISTYLLTIMNMVSALYKDPSIGNSIEIVVVRIIVLEDDENDPDLNLTQNAQNNLDRFCSWQHKQNSANENDPHHHDVAILVTRKNICGNNCMTLGLANVGGMCKPKQSCSVNEDNGIMLSHTITHELGHNFGMFHDTAKIGCHPRVGSIVHIMTPTFGADTLQVCWSNCSRKYITHFLDQGLGDCLDDSPSLNNEFYKNKTEALPGERYNAERQCQMQFNLTSEDNSIGTCSAPHEICSTLWCRVNGECVTNMRPTAPGTSCGKRKWCQNGKCVRIEEQTPIHGGWGNWSEWSECSRSCGGGVTTQHRDCNNPLPANGGVFCIGERKRYKICKKKSCPENEVSFRARQCANYNNVSYQGSLYKWQPFFDKNNPCKLFCTDEDDTIIANWADTVLDGTPCTLGTNNMCIDGICKKVGCDWIVDSEMQEDRCGICGGTGDQCKPVKEIFGEDLNVTEGYVEIVTIPAKSRHIVIQELATSQNFLGVAHANSGKFYLNGDSLISMPGEFMIAGAESLYDRLDDQETIKIPQPIQHAITLYVIVRVNETNEGIYYEFTLPAFNVSSGNQYMWNLSNWTACTVTCGVGVQYREPTCYENDKMITDTVPCWTNARNRRPQRQTRQCNKSINPCPAQWWTGPWQFCPVTCKQPGTPHPVKRRSIMCLDQRDVVVSDAHCKLLPRPTETEYCDQHLPECKTG